MRAKANPDVPAASDADDANPRISLVFSGVVMCVLLFAIADSFQWPATVRLLVNEISAGAAPLTSMTLMILPSATVF